MNTEDSSYETNSSAIDVVRQVLEKARMQPVPLGDAPGFAASFEDEGPDVTVYSLVYESEGRLVFYLEFNTTTPKNSLSQVAEFITRVNYGITIGNYELDYSTGTVRFKSSIDYRGMQLQPVMVQRVILSAMDAVEPYAQALIEVMQGRISARQAFLAADVFVETDDTE